MNFFRKKPPLNQRSQIAVIITFVIAVVILFIVVFINITKVSQVKTTTSQAADKAALSLASQLGSISHYYKEKVLKISGPCATPSCQVCSTDLVSLVMLVGVPVLLTAGYIVASPLMLAATAVLGVANVVNLTMLSGINTEFAKMSGKNAMRESALFQALASTQSDDVGLIRTGAGLFHDEFTGRDYNLNNIPEMRNEREVNRFFAWYYTKRLLFAGDDYLKQAVDTFKNRLNKVIDIERDSAQWKINKLSYFIEPGPASEKADYEITCASGTCPPWVKNIELKQIVIIKIDVTKPKGADQIIRDCDRGCDFPRGKFLNLAQRLKNSYGLSFCAKGSLDSVYCNDIDFLMLDLWDFLLKIKEVSDMPASYAYKNVEQWLPAFYNFKMHKPDRTSVDDTFSTPLADFNNDRADFNRDYSYDIYLRLIRDQIYINSWITELENLNSPTTGIAKTISSANGHNEYGRGDAVSQCNTDRCCDCSDCECKYCCKPGNCSFKGIYCSAWGGPNPPVCQHGDLYGIIPSWCPLGNRSVKCDSTCSSCSTNSQRPSACDFQGQLSWRPSASGQFDGTDKPTEVEQALKILRALNYNITQIKGIISDLADKVDFYFNPVNKGEFFTDANNNGVYDEGEDYEDSNGNKAYDSVRSEVIKRDEITYAWKDKKGFSHLAAVKIDGYPIKLPYVTESIEWGGIIPQKCRKLNDYQGDFKITTWRYDQDQPTDIGKTDKGGWSLRRRKYGLFPGGEEFPPGYVAKIAEDVQDNGKIDTYEEYVKSILYNFAITSCSKAHYGTEKSDIYITETKCD